MTVSVPSVDQDTRLRVLVLATYFPKPGNPLMGTWALAPAQAMLRNGVDVRVVSPTSWIPRSAARIPALARWRSWAECPASYEWDGLRVDYPRWLWYAQAGPLHQVARRRPLPQLELGWRSVRASLERAVAEHRPDVIYAHHASIGGYLALRLHRATGLPYAVIEHDHGEIADCVRFPHRRRVYEEVIGAASAVVAVASPMKDTIERLFPGAPVHVVHNAADLPDPSLPATPRPPELRDRPVVFSAAHLYERKGMPVLVEAFARIAERHPAALLRIAGEGEDRARIERAIAKAGLGDRVTLLGRTSHDRVLQEMAWADVFALIGWDEPHAIAHMEAMASGTPVLCADDGGIMDIFESGVQGCAVPPRDPGAAAEALDRMLSDELSRRRMGEAGRALVGGRHTWDANGRALTEILRGAAGPSLATDAAPRS